MIDVTGHFHDDDSQKGHADVRTRLKTGRRGASVERLLTLHPDTEART
ncbi:MAG: hypothetical protein IMZ55_03385 [Acidobacteria bacterium]|nr:hypothetical protein [Acidobacteriota bacterium]